MKKETVKKRTIKISICLTILISFIILFHYVRARKIIEFSLYFLLFLFVGYKIIFKAFFNIKNGQIFDENLLMLIASIGAFILSEYSEAVAVLVFYEIGEIFQSYAVNKTRKSITDLMDEPTSVFVEREGAEEVDPYEVEVGETILVRSGEKVAIDGIVVQGEAFIDSKAITGESVPQKVIQGNSILSGVIVNGGVLKIKTTKTYENSTVMKIIETVQDVSEKKSRPEQFISKFAKYYTPIVVCFAFLTFLILLACSVGVKTALFRALTFLVISCPCALVISIPISFFGGIASLSKQGILIKGSVFVERFAKTNNFAFDKTGTLTKGDFKVLSVYPQEKKTEILQFASICEAVSVHPIANAIKGDEIELSKYKYFEVAGKGVKCVSSESEIICGKKSYLEENGIKCFDYDSVNTLVFVAKNKICLGVIEIGDTLKDETKEVVLELNKYGNTALISGDNNKVVEYFAKLLNIKYFKGELLPNEKSEELKKFAGYNKGFTAYVGDGINDAVCLCEADVGISFGINGADVALEYSDLVLMKDNLKDIFKAKKLCKKTMSIVKQNIILSIGIKVIVMILSALGFANMWLAVFADVGVAILAILNAMRTFKKIEN